MNHMWVGCGARAAQLCGVVKTWKTKSIFRNITKLAIFSEPKDKFVWQAQVCTAPAVCLPHRMPLPRRSVWRVRACGRAGGRAGRRAGAQLPPSRLCACPQSICERRRGGNTLGAWLTGVRVAVVARSSSRAARQWT